MLPTHYLHQKIKQAIKYVLGTKNKTSYLQWLFKMLVEYINVSNVNIKPNIKQNLIDTQSIHEGVRHPCPQCEFKGKEPSQLRQHVKSVHEGVCYPCDLCAYLL